MFVSNKAVNLESGYAWSHNGSNKHVFGIADGYSGSIGKKASVLLTQFLKTSIEMDIDAITEDNAVMWMSTFFDNAEMYLSAEIIRYLNTYYETKTNPHNDAIYWRDGKTDNHWAPLDCGCSFVLVIIVNGCIFTASVGDCSAVITSPNKSFETHDIGMIRDCAMANIYTFASEDRYNTPTKNLVLTYDHSPASWYEYCRFKIAHYTDSVQFLYDKLDDETKPFVEIFQKTAEGTATSGNYFKNVEKEFGTVIKKTTDGRKVLSNTRGFLNKDFKPFGVTHKPTISLLRMDDVCRRNLEEDDSNLYALLLGTSSLFSNWIRTFEKASELGESDEKVVGNFLHKTLDCRDNANAVLEGLMKHSTTTNTMCGILVYFDATYL